MRRPLFGNGIPRNILVADGEVTVLDTEDLNAGEVYALTLFLWIYQPGPGPFTNPALGVSVRTNGGPPVAAATCIPQYLDSFFNTTNPTRIEPIKLLDRLMLRGKQRVTIQATVDGTPSPVALVWGYFEMTGEQDTGIPFRGLQPSKPASPFGFAPVQVSAPANINNQAPIHRLDPTYIDLVTIDVANFGLSDGSFNWGAVVAFPGNVLVPMPSLSIFPDAPGPGAFRHRVFDGIPMKAVDSSDAGSLIQIAAGSGPTVLANIITAYGSFVRS